jgi:hypothetical protein
MLLNCNQNLTIKNGKCFLYKLKLIQNTKDTNQKILFHKKSRLKRLFKSFIFLIFKNLDNFRII